MSSRSGAFSGAGRWAGDDGPWARHWQPGNGGVRDARGAAIGANRVHNGSRVAGGGPSPSQHWQLSAGPFKQQERAAEPRAASLEQARLAPGADNSPPSASRTPPKLNSR